MRNKILFIGSNASFNAKLSAQLMEKGYETLFCPNGKGAIELINANTSSLEGSGIVIDLKLTDISGIRLGELINLLYPSAVIAYYNSSNGEYNGEEKSVSPLLPEPLTSTALISELEKLSPSGNNLPAEKPARDGADAFALIKINNGASFFKIFSELNSIKNVVHCDATKGDIDIFVQIHAGSQEECSKIFDGQIKTIDGIKEGELLFVSEPELNGRMKEIIHSAGILLPAEAWETARSSKELVCSYLVASIDNGKIQNALPLIKLKNNVVYCDYTKGKYNVVLMVKGKQFVQIDKFIESQMLNLEGILKVKEYPVINIYEM